MRRVAFVVFVVLLLVIGGGLTAQIASNGSASAIPSLIRQVGDPNGSVLDSAPWKAEQFFLLTGFLLFNLIGMGLTIAVIMWLLHRGLRRSRAAGGSTPTPATTTAPASEEAPAEEAA